MSDLDPAALSGWMAEAVPALGRPVSLFKFPGGQSNPTYRLDAEKGSAVLRRKPFGPLLPSAHAIEREYRIISALHPAGFPVAAPLALCEEPEVIGAPFYLMGLLDGRSFTDGGLPGVVPISAGPAIISTARSSAGASNIARRKPMSCWIWSS